MIQVVKALSKLTCHLREKGHIAILIKHAVIGGSVTDCLTLVRENVAEARVATVFYFLQMEKIGRASCRERV